MCSSIAKSSSWLVLTISFFAYSLLLLLLSCSSLSTLLLLLSLQQVTVMEACRRHDSQHSWLGKQQDMEAIVSFISLGMKRLVCDNSCIEYLVKMMEEEINGASRACFVQVLCHGVKELSMRRKCWTWCSYWIQA